MKKVSPYWFLLLLLAICFTLATLFVPRAANWKQPSQTGNVLITLLGGRQALANELFIMGDVYFHSGYYPSIFDKQETDKDVADPAHGRAEDSGGDFLGPPKDWIAALGRHFVPNRHTHLSSGGANGHEHANTVEEILPWMKLSAEMNPHMIESYNVGSYWLSAVLHQPKQARDFLFEGIRANPQNPQLFFDLGRLYEANYFDTNRAENVWATALKYWNAQPENAKTNTESQFLCDEIAVNLARIEENRKNYPEAIHYFEIAKSVSPRPHNIDLNIDQVRQEMKNSATNSTAP